MCTPGISLVCEHRFVSTSRRQYESLESTFKSWREDSYLYSHVLVITVNVYHTGSEHICVMHCSRVSATTSRLLQEGCNMLWAERALWGPVGGFGSFGPKDP